MNKSLRHWTLGLAVAFAAAGMASIVPLPFAHAQDAAPVDQVTLVEELESQAFKAIRGGEFDRSSELLTKAAATSKDPKLVRMAEWATQFETQQQAFAAERKKQYDKEVANVHLLLDHQFEVYAIDVAARAYLLTTDKKGFRNEKWVDTLVKDSSAEADRFEESEQWLKALRIYSDLGSIEPANPEWKTKLKLATRRIRLLSLYTPDVLKRLVEAEGKERLAADKLIHPESATQPATRPVEADDTSNDNFKLDWHQTLSGISYDMLHDALADADKNYYRDISYRQLMIGGLTGLRTLVTTKGLEGAFPKLADEAKRQRFIRELDSALAEARGSTPDTEEGILFQDLTVLRTRNRETVDLPEQVFVSEFADGAFAELDPFSSMIWPYDLEEFNKTTQGEFSGVGIQIQSDDDGSLKVISPLEDSPAYKAGLKAGDVVTHINGKNAKGITLNQAVKTITGPVRTQVTLTVRSPDGTTKNYTITRETIKVASIKGYVHKPGGGWNYFIDPDQKVAYIRLTNFTKTSGEELTKAVEDLKVLGARGVILDLRYNPGGLLQAATEVSEKFIKDGVIVSTHADRETPNQPTVASASSDTGQTEMPLVVLVNQYSASASEIVSGALKDHQRALIVGERTFGKGSVQMLFPLAREITGRPSAYLKLTTSHYYLPSGRCIHREENSTEWGVDPDVTIEMTPEQMRAAIDARTDLDVLRDADNPDKVAISPTTAPTTQPNKKDLLACDPQLSAALLVLRLQLSGAQL